MKIYYVLSVPVSIVFILTSDAIHPAYRMSWPKRFVLGFKMFLNTLRIRTGTSYKAHMVMALKLLETPPEVPGDIIECGTWKGGSAANLSLICKIVGRKLRIFDSFEGLPQGNPADREAKYYQKGDYCGQLEEVKANIQRCGAIECCEFNKGWFDSTLPNLDSPVLLAFLDVDLEASLEVCVRYIWPNLADRGFIFIDEVVGVDYCALFYSEKYWRTYFDRAPPGLIGAGLGLALGEYYIGPWPERTLHPTQHANAGAYTRKDMSGVWTYYPEV
jgi:O-methyltransferase